MTWMSIVDAFIFSLKISLVGIAFILGLLVAVLPIYLLAVKLLEEKE